jgi:inorganic pyrophosphatase
MKSATIAKARSDAAGKTVEVVIETPKGSRNKLAYEPRKRMYKLSKVLPEGMSFPYDFGFIPDTKADDGDPIDVLVLTDTELFPGCLLDCNLVGVIELEQQEESKMVRNDRLIAVASESILYSSVKHISQLNPTVLSQIEAFFINYQKLRDVKVKILGRQGPDQAWALLRRSKK